MVRMLTVPGLFPPPDYSHAAVVEAGERLVFTAGAVPLDAAGSLVSQDLVGQTGQVIANLAEALRAAGSDLRYVLASTVYVVATDPGDLATVWQVVRASGLAVDPADAASGPADAATNSAAGPHTSTLLGVACLGYPGQLVEITAVASVPGPTAGRPGQAEDVIS